MSQFVFEHIKGNGFKSHVIENIRQIEFSFFSYKGRNVMGYNTNGDRYFRFEFKITHEAQINNEPTNLSFAIEGGQRPTERDVENIIDIKNFLMEIREKTDFISDRSFIEIARGFSELVKYIKNKIEEKEVSEQEKKLELDIEALNKTTNKLKKVEEQIKDLKSLEKINNELDETVNSICK